MTERKLIQCPVCHGSTKEVQGVLCCIANCRVQFWGLSQDKWYVGTEEDLAAAKEKIAELTLRLEKVSNRHLFSIVHPDLKCLGQDITDEMSQAYHAAGETPDEAWRAMWKAADDDLYRNPATNSMLKRCIEIAWERGFKGAHNSAPNARSIDIGTVIHVAFEELQRENPDLFKDLIPEQFN
jgi:hypothetical protein